MLHTASCLSLGVAPSEGDVTIAQLGLNACAQQLKNSLQERLLPDCHFPALKVGSAYASRPLCAEIQRGTTICIIDHDWNNHLDHIS